MKRKMKQQDQDLSLYKIAKYISRELMMASQLTTAGANQAKVLEKYEKNANSIRNLAIFTKIMFAIFFAGYTLLPLFAYLELMELLLTGVSIDALILTASFIIMIFFSLQIVYFLVIAIPVVGELMSGQAFRWLESLPISKKKIRKLGFLTIFRTYDVPLIIMLFGFPIVMLIGTQNVLVFIACLGISILNVIFTFCVLILLSERMNRLMKNNEGNSKKAGILRIVVMLSYVILTFTVIMSIQWVLTSIDEIFVFFSTLQASGLINYFLSLIPYPSSLGYLITSIMIPFEIPIGVWITTLVGFTLFMLLTRKAYKGALLSLRSVTSEEFQVSTIKSPGQVQEGDIKIEIKPLSPIKAFLRKDLSTASRDMQTLMFLIMPIVLPFIMMFSFTSAIPDSPDASSAMVFLIPWSMLLLFCVFSSLMLITGLLNIEESGSSMLASLPINSRDQAIAKLVLILTFQTLGYILPMVTLIINFSFFSLVLLTLAALPIVWATTLVVFELKVYLFGKMRFKFVLEEVNKRRKVLKWLLIVTTEGGICLGTIIAVNIFYSILGPLFTAGIFFIVGCVFLSSALLIFTQMFPNLKQRRYYPS